MGLGVHPLKTRVDHHLFGAIKKVQTKRSKQREPFFLMRKLISEVSKWPEVARLVNGDLSASNDDDVRLARRLALVGFASVVPSRADEWAKVKLGNLWFVTDGKPVQRLDEWLQQWHSDGVGADGPQRRSALWKTSFRIGMLLERVKWDRERDGVEKPSVPHVAYELSWSPAAMLVAWLWLVYKGLDGAVSAETPVWCRWSQGGVGVRGYSVDWVSNQLAAVARATVNVDTGSRGWRVAATNHLLDCGVPQSRVRLMGGWRDEETMNKTLRATTGVHGGRVATHHECRLSRETQ